MIICIYISAGAKLVIPPGEIPALKSAAVDKTTGMYFVYTFSYS